MNKITAQAPAKLIISGEHSVVYNQTALVTAINCFTNITFNPINSTKFITTTLTNFKSITKYPLTSLINLTKKLDNKFNQFINGEIPIKYILNKPDELIIYTIANIIKKIPCIKKNNITPGNLIINSNLPIGAGLGSSASTIAAVITLFNFMLELGFSDEEKLQQVIFCERLQHGKGSSLDARAVIYGGGHYLIDNQAKKINFLNQENNFFWLNHGIPASSTGECVQYVSKFKNDYFLWEEFKNITKQLANDFLTNPINLLKENHKLLVRIGVVSEKAQQLIKEIEQIGGAGKVSGAGTIKGNDNGIILIYHLDKDKLVKFLRTKNLIANQLIINNEGAKIIENN